MESSFSDQEWQRFFKAGRSPAKRRHRREDRPHPGRPCPAAQAGRWHDQEHMPTSTRRNIHNNRLQVINQYEVARWASQYANRYDVTVLVNGLPMVHVELKRRGVDIREAFNQINRYQRDSFWAGSGLFEYVQLFVISNGTLTKYYSNTTRDRHTVEHVAADARAEEDVQHFEFTSWWADAPNKPIPDLTGFTKTFFAKHTLLNILTRYCVLDSTASCW